MSPMLRNARTTAAVLLLLSAADTSAAVSEGYAYTLLAYRAADINDHGQLIGSIGSSGQSVGFIDDHGTISTVSYPGSTSTSFTAINDRGEITGLAAGPGSQHYFIFYQGEFITLSLPDLAQPLDINERGDVVGYFYDLGGTHGFLYTDGAMHLIDVPGSDVTIALGINDRGEIVGEYGMIGAARSGFLLAAGTFTTVAYPGAIATSAHAINNKGEIVGLMQYADQTPYHGFVYRHGTWEAVDVPCTDQQASTDTFPRSINEQGVIIGDWSAYPNAGSFMAKPVHGARDAAIGAGVACAG